MLCHTGRCPGTCSSTVTGRAQPSHPAPAGWCWCHHFPPPSSAFPSLLLGTCVTKLSQGTESLSWGSTPSRNLHRARTKVGTAWGWASGALTSAWWASRWIQRAQVRAAFGVPLVCVGNPTPFLNKVIPQQELFKITALVLLCCSYNRRFKPFQGSDLPWAFCSHVL